MRPRCWRACIQRELLCGSIPSRSCMKSRRTCAAALLFLFTATAFAQYRAALPGYRYDFPRDHFNHPDFQTEWWYYTGNLTSTEGHRFGFELTFFRQAVDRDSKPTNAWDVRDLYVAHLALSDLDSRKFLHAERTNRAGPGIAGVSELDRRIWNGNWQVTWRGDDQVLQVTGTAWMDHEFFTHQLDTDQVGWDWLSVQLQDNTELMLFHIRRNDGSIDGHSAGTFVDASGNTTHLRKDEFTLEPLGVSWTSPETHAVYPLRWRVSIPKLGLALESSTSLPAQELASPTGLLPAYWEGAIVFDGLKGEAPIRGVGYLEMTGYDHPMRQLRIGASPL